MKQGLTEIVFIIDQSASMKDYSPDAVSTFNSLLAQYREKYSDGLLTTVFFSKRSRIVHDRISLSDAAPLSQEDCQPQDKTALLDAMGATLRHIFTIQKYARDEDRPQDTIFVIHTDGRDDASKIYRIAEIEQTISRRMEKNGWQFVFTGAGLDSIITSAKLAQAAAPQQPEDEKGMADDLTEYVDDLLRLFENRKN